LSINGSRNGELAAPEIDFIEFAAILGHCRLRPVAARFRLIMLKPATMSGYMPQNFKTQLSLSASFVDKVISLPEAAHLLGVSPDTLRRCHKRNELTIIKLSPRRVGVRLSDLKAFLEGRAI
jgi:excisionase family DNA binding protein